MTSRPYTWEQLRRLSLARQFPRVRGRGVDAVVRTVELAGPLQTQTARSAFLGIAARLPGVTHASITEAYERFLLVRGSTIRGTVHTSTPGQHVWLDRATRVGSAALWARTLGVPIEALDPIWHGIEAFAGPVWRSVDELVGHLYPPDEAVRSPGETDRTTDTAPEARGAGSSTPSTLSRAMSFGHGGLIRRPRSGGWAGQGAAEYRWVAAALAGPDASEHAELEKWRRVGHRQAMANVALLHLHSHGPATRADLAWWAGFGLREADAALAALGDQVCVRPGPDGRDYWDRSDGVRPGIDDVGTRLLPEFDATLCGYHPKGRDRFVSPAAHDVLWSAANGLLRAPVLHAGRLVGWWRADGTGRKRRIEVTPFAEDASAGRTPSAAALSDAALTAADALDWQLTDLEVRPAGSSGRRDDAGA